MILALNNGLPWVEWQHALSGSMPCNASVKALTCTLQVGC